MTDPSAMEPVLHVGLPKTGTTSLQKGVFPYLPGIRYLGKGLPSGESRGYLTAALGTAVGRVLYEDSVLSINRPTPSESLARAVSEASPGPGRVLLSAEEFVHPSTRDVGLVAERLSEALPDAHILLTVRSQTTYLMSWWAHVGRAGKYLHRGRRFAPTAWRNLTPEEWWSQVGSSPLNDMDRILNQFAVWQEYFDLFGGRVTVLPMEWLSLDPERYAASLAAVLGCQASAVRGRLAGARFNMAPHVPPGTSHNNGRRWRRQPAAGAPSALRKTGWIERSLSGLVYRLPMKHVEPTNFFALAAQRYAESNELAAKEWGIDLGRLGYPMPPLSSLQT